MEQINEAQHLPSASNPTPVKRSPYLRFVVMLVVGLTFTNAGVMAVTQSTQLVLVPTNPFLEYADLFPGNRMSEAEAKSYSCWGSNNYYFASEVTCNFTPKSDVFSNIEIVISDGRIRLITFTLRDKTIKIGDLVLMFDSPRFRTYPHAVFFFWNKFFVIVSTTARGNAAALRPAWSVTITNQN